MSRSVHIAPLIAVALFVFPTGASADGRCVGLKKGDFVYAIGSSTMGISLGPAIERKVEKAGLKFRKWAKASSGLARPDFHDWPKQVPDVVREWKPDAFVISLGTNDYQAINTGKGWIKHTETEKWKAAYAARVDRMLEVTAGKDKSRPVIWVGPTPFPGSKARMMSRRINAIIKDRIARFGGKVQYIDMVSRLMRGKKLVRTFKSSSGKTRKVYGKDGVHLTGATVRELMAAPVIELLTCE